MMNRYMLALLALLILASPVFAEVPKTMNMQGALTDAEGNPVIDDDYYVDFRFYTSANATSPIWTNDWDIAVVDGMFNFVMDMTGFLDLGIFADELWLGLAIAGETESVPRIRLTSVPYAFRAAIADSVAGGGGSGADSDWDVVGDDIFHENGRVFIGVAAGAAAAGLPGENVRGNEEREIGDRTPSASKVRVVGINEGLYSSMQDTDGLADQRAGLYGSRNRNSRNDGTGFAANDISGGTIGYNLWGDSYTFGVAGHTWFDFPYTAGVLGANNTGSTWGALAYLDVDLSSWGLYTPHNAHVGGTAELIGLRLPIGAAAGNILTSDGAGNASWASPGAANADDDWAISGDDLIHEAAGTVAIGTNTPRAVLTGQSTVQISSTLWPGLALDRTSSSFKRWALYQEGISGDFHIGYANVAGYAPSPVFIFGDDGRASFGLGVLGNASLSLKGGNGDVAASAGDLNISAGAYGFRVGVHGSGPAAGEVNLRARTTTDVGRLDLGVDDHDVISIEDYEANWLDSSGNRMVRILGENAMGEPGGFLSMYNPSSGATTLYLNGDAGGGGEIAVYNSTGTSTLKLDGDHNGTGQSRVTTASLEITGGADLSEQFDIGSGDTQAESGMVVSIDPNRPGRLALSNSTYDHRVAGVISGAGGVKTGMLMGQSGSLADGELPVALAGRVYVWADADQGAIEPGDLLTTSNRPGHAMRVGDRDRAAGAVLGKAMTGLSEGRGLVLVLVSLQ